jgi:hypothetical protein
MRYAILIYENEADFAQRQSPPDGVYWASWMAYSAAMNPVTTGGAPLEAPASATTLRLREGRRLVQDGPYAETREQLGGFFLIDVPDLDAALDWAAKCPAAASGVVEVRPLMAMMAASAAEAA